MRLQNRGGVVACLLLIGMLLSSGAAEAQPRAASPGRPPNIIIVIADDLGYGELGSYGQDKIRTPHLDRLAAEGVRLTQFYSGSPVCAPSRATLLTGRHTGHTYVRGNYELGGFGDDEEGGQLAMRSGTETMATMLKEAGYATAAIGKWGLGGLASPDTAAQAPEAGLPYHFGFDLFYGYLDQKQAHNYYPTHLWRVTAEQGAVWDTLANDYFSPHQRLDEVPEQTSAYDPYRGEEYAPDRMHAEALRFIQEHQDESFFLYLAPTVPHVSLQVPDEELVPYDFEETPYLGQQNYLPHPRPRAAYAGMISRMDRQIGEVVALVGSLGLGDNTLVVFTSDNGTTYNGGTEADFFASVGELRGLKGSVYEGGIRVPMVARWPGRIPAGRVSEAVGALWDLLPTVAEATGAPPLDSLDGISLLPALTGAQEAAPASSSETDTSAVDEAFAERPPLYWEYFGLCEGQQALRAGRWKIVRLGVHEEGAAPVELYDLETDPEETTNVAVEHPEVARRLARLLQEARTISPVARWSIVTPPSEAPLAEGTPRHTCFPWNQ
ncbi:MAG: arylsulfatase [Rhodothermales bacterium]